MGVLQRCSKLVFRCFKCVEKTADAVTGAVGPVFITLAVVLISLGVFTFFATIAPTLRFPILSIPICLLLATNLLAQYFYVCTVSPGFIEDDPISTTQDRDALHWAKRSPASGATWSERRLAGDANRSPQQCRKCMKPRPERAHHCSVCKRCILKYDHHCPVGINQCVGLRNERHFVLFMAYLSLCCGSFVFLGWSLIWDAIKFEDWDYYAPRTAFILTYVLAIAIGFSVSVMLLWQVYMLSSGETAVENSDNGRYTRLAKRRGTTFINSFDLGRRKNLELFFNIGPTGYPAWTLLFPLRVPPYTDGWTWARRPGMTEHEGITVDDELTDDDDD